VELITLSDPHCYVIINKLQDAVFVKAVRNTGS